MCPRALSRADVPTPAPLLTNTVLPLTCFASGAPVGDATVTFDARVWSVPLRTDIVHRVVIWQQKKARKTLYATRTRDNVRGGGRKPWKQKGTGKARAGSIRSPLWRGGGVALGPVHRDWSIALPKRIRRLGLRVALSAKLRDGRLVVVDSLDMGRTPPTSDAGAAVVAERAAAAGDAGRTRSAVALLTRNGLTRAAATATAWTPNGDGSGAPLRLLFLDAAAAAVEPQGRQRGGVPPSFARATRNLRAVRSLPASAANVLDIVRAEVLVVTPAAVAALTAHLLDDGTAP